MGTVIRNDQFYDKYSQEVIEQIRALSPELNEYVVTEQYLFEADNPDLVDAKWLRNRLLIKLFDQLEANGIVINMDRDEFVDDPVIVQAAIGLRAKMDAERLYLFLKDRHDLRNELTELVGDDCISDICTTIADYLPYDEGWESISVVFEGRPGLISSTSLFNEMLGKVFDHCDRLGDPSIIADDEFEKMNLYMEVLHHRKAKITRIAEIVYAADDNGEITSDTKKSAVASYMQSFENELARPTTMRDFLESGLDPEEFMTKTRDRYLNNWKHCLEYWLRPEHRQELPNHLVVSVLVSTLYVDAPDQAHARIHVVETFEGIGYEFGSQYKPLRDLIDRALGNIVIVEGGLNETV